MSHMFAPLLRKFRKSKPLASASHVDATKLKLGAAVKPAVESLEERTLGTYAAPTTTVLGTSVSRISAADVNNDGAADLLAANTLGTASVLLSNGDGTFAPVRSYSAGADAMDIKSADLNHDGNPDVLVANQLSAGTVTVLMGHGDGSFDGQRSYYAYSGPFRMVVADFDHDGNDDVAVANSYSSSYVSILHGNGDGSLILDGTYDAG